MKNETALINAMLAAIVAVGSLGLAADKGEKCYGVAKAGKNDCQTATSACAGSSKQDANPTAFIFLPQGSCEKIVGGSLTPKS
jgi:uncharacterized membrane protein